MDLVKTLEDIMLVGSEWILYLLILLSVLTLAIALERFFYLRKSRVDFRELITWFSSSIEQGKQAELELRCRAKQAPEHALILESLKYSDAAQNSLDHRLKLLIHGAKQDMDKNILFLGTVGSNAPFIGLLGTVFGVIEAFHQLAVTGAGGSSAVMAGISEALVATGVGLIVAIPAVVLFNAFQRVIKTRVANLEALRDLVLSYKSRGGNASKVA